MEKWQKYLDKAVEEFAKELKNYFEGEIDEDGSSDNGESLLESAIENVELDEEDEEFYKEIEEFIYDNIPYDKMVRERWQEYMQPSDLEEFGRYWE